MATSKRPTATAPRGSSSSLGGSLAASSQQQQQRQRLSTTSTTFSQADDEEEEDDDPQAYERRLAAFMADDDEEDEGEGAGGAASKLAAAAAAAVEANGEAVAEEEEEEEEQFFYSEQHRRKHIYQDDDEEDVSTSEAATDLQGQSYDERLRAALGSDDEEEAAASSSSQLDEEEEAEDSFVYPGASSSVAGTAAADDSAILPDRSRTLRSPAPSISSIISRTPNRPTGYPALSRLRSSALGLGPSPAGTAGAWSPSASRQSSFRGVSGASHLLGYSRTGGSEVDVASRSRASSVSLASSRVGAAAGARRPRRTFPYGPASLGAASHLAHPERSSAAGGAGSADVSISGSMLLHPASASVAGASSEVGVAATAPRPPFRWAALRRISPQLNVPPTRPDAQAAHPSVMAVAGGLVAVGRSDGVTLVFGFAQDEKAVMGSSEAREAGAVTALALSSDHTYVAVGHSKGHIFLYDISHPSSAARQVAPVEAAAVRSGRKEGHLVGSRILHLGFVGARRTAIVSADEHGLAFFHALGKILGVSSNDTLRLLGRYPEPVTSSKLGVPNGNRAASTTTTTRRSTVLAMAPLPLGPASHHADTYNFTALLTPSKLVLVGIKPSARTWYRRLAPAPSAAATTPADTPLNGASTPLNGAAAQGQSGEPHVNGSNGDTQPQAQPRTVSGALAWFPAAQAEEVSSCTSSTGQIEPILAYAFGATLHFLRLARTRVAVARAAGDTRSAATFTDELDVREEQGYEHDALIVALQWLSHEHLVLLSSDNTLHLFSLRTRRCTAAQGLTQLVPPLVAHDWKGLLETHLHAAAAAAEGEEEKQQLVVPSGRVLAKLAPLVAHSLRTHKAQVFLLTTRDVVVGTPLTWADHILTLVSAGDLLGAINLGTAYYTGAAPQGALGLPEEREAQQKVVGARVRELMRASVQYAFSPERLTDATHVTPDGRGVDRTELFQGIARACAEACLALQDLELLFDEVYDAYAENGIEAIFVEQMEQFIVEARIRTLPIPVVQRLVAFRKARGEYELAEQVIWHVDPACLDLDQALSLCLEQKLYDALIYVHNSAMADYVAPLIELLEVLKRVLRSREQAGSEMDEEREEEDEAEDVYKIFSYLSVILTGSAYPSQEALSTEQATRAKSSLYSFIFSGRCVSWPEGKGGSLVFTTDDQREPTYPYLRLLLRFDAEAFLDALDVAFEDGYLDDDERADEAVTRQLIVSILLEITDVNEQDAAAPLDGAIATFAHLFVARNAPKYPQFIDLQAAQLQRLLVALSSSDDATTREDRQLAVECLLSAFRPTHTDDLLALFEGAGFYRILQSAYRSAGKWDRLVSMILRDPEGGSGTFAQLTEVLAKAARSPARETYDGKLRPLILDATPQLVAYAPRQAACLIDHFFPAHHSDALARLEEAKSAQLAYLAAFLDANAGAADELANELQPLDPKNLDAQTRDLYVSLLAELEPAQVVRNLDALGAAFFDLEHVAEACEMHACYDAVLWALDRAGRRSEAFEALDRIMAMQAIVLRADDAVEEDGALSEEASLAAEQLRGLVGMAVRLCIEGAAAAPGSNEVTETWFQLLRSLLALVHGVVSTAAEADEATAPQLQANGSMALQFSRNLVQDTLNALISSTSAESISFPTLFRRLVAHDDASGSSAGRYYAEVKSVLDGMLSAYRLRSDLLGITNRLFDRDVFSALAKLTRQRRRGWRPLSGRARCAGCAEPLFNAAKRDAALTTQQPQPRRMSSVERTSSFPRSVNGGANATPTTRLDEQDEEEVPLPRLDKGKGVDRALDNEADAGPASQGYFAESAVTAAAAAAALAAATPQLEQSSFDLSPAATAAGAEMEGQEEDEEDGAVVVLRTGEAWHRRCAAFV